MNKEIFQRTIQNLVVTFTSQSKEERELAEKDLKEICTKNIKF